MRVGSPGYVLVFLGILCTVAAAAHTRAIEDRPWLVFEGDVFTLYSNVSPGQSRKLFRDLQLYYAVFHLLTSTSPARRELPINFYAFDRERDWDRFRMQLSTYGDYAHSRVARGGFHATYFGRRKHLSFDLKKSFAEHLFLTQPRRDYPIWYELGMNHYLASIRHRNSVFRVGESEAARYDAWANLKGIDEVLDPDDAFIRDELSYKFRYESWRLYHYLSHGSEEAREQFAARLPEYLRMRAGGASEVQAFEQGLGIPVDGLDGKMRQFYSRRKHRFRTIGMQDWVREEAIPVPRTLTPGESAWVLGRLARVMGRSEEAERLFRRAAGSAAPPLDAEIACVLARLDVEAPIEHVARIEQVLAERPSHAGCMIEQAEAMLDTALQESSPTRIAELALGIRELAIVLLQSNRKSAAAFVVYGRSHLLPGQDASQAVDPLAVARDLVPHDRQTRLFLAQAYRAVNDCERAREELRFVMIWAERGEEVRAAAVRLFDEIGSSCGA